MSIGPSFGRRDKIQRPHRRWLHARRCTDGRRDDRTVPRRRRRGLRRRRYVGRHAGHRRRDRHLHVRWPDHRPILHPRAGPARFRADGRAGLLHLRRDRRTGLLRQRDGNRPVRRAQPVRQLLYQCDRPRSVGDPNGRRVDPRRRTRPVGRRAGRVDAGLGHRDDRAWRLHVWLGQSGHPRDPAIRRHRRRPNAGQLAGPLGRPDRRRCEHGPASRLQRRAGGAGLGRPGASSAGDQSGGWLGSVRRHRA